MIAGLLSRAWGYLAAAAFAVGLIVAVWSLGQQSGRDAVTAEAARRGEEAREAGNAAARDAERDGAVDRLRGGGF